MNKNIFRSRTVIGAVCILLCRYSLKAKSSSFVISCFSMCSFSLVQDTAIVPCVGKNIPVCLGPLMLFLSLLHLVIGSPFPGCDAVSFLFGQLHAQVLFQL